jgi:hypothetical protein
VVSKIVDVYAAGATQEEAAENVIDGRFTTLEPTVIDSAMNFMVGLKTFRFSLTVSFCKELYPLTPTKGL